MTSCYQEVLADEILAGCSQKPPIRQNTFAAKISSHRVVAYSKLVCTTKRRLLQGEALQPCTMFGTCSFVERVARGGGKVVRM